MLNQPTYCSRCNAATGSRNERLPGSVVLIRCADCGLVKNRLYRDITTPPLAESAKEETDGNDA